MTIKAKILSLVFAFALMAGAITALGLNTVNDYKTIGAAHNRASDNAFKGERLNRYLMASAVEMRGIYLAESRADLLVQADRVDDRANRLHAFLKEWQADLKASELPEFNQVMIDCMDIVNGGHHLAKLAREQGQAAAAAYGNRDTYRISREAKQARIDAMVARISGEMRATRRALVAYQDQRIQQFVIIAAAGTLLLLFASLWIAIRSITSPLNRVKQSIIRISEGMYDTPLPEKTESNEIGEIWGALAILKVRAMEADRLTREELEREHKLRELVLD